MKACSNSPIFPNPLNFGIFRHFQILAGSLAVSFLVLCSHPLLAQHSSQVTESVDFVESWVLSKDRAGTLKQLVPGTETSFFFHALHYQQTGQVAPFKATMSAWKQTLNPDSPFPSELYNTLQNRSIFLNYANDPAGSIKKLSKLLKLKLDHQRPIPPEEANIPTTLDDTLVSEQAFYKQATTKDAPYTVLKGHALVESLNKAPTFDRTQRLWFLKHLSHSDFPQIPPLILAELKYPSKPSFSSIPGTSHLLLDQLLWLEKQHPTLREQESFVCSILRRFRPGDSHYLLFHPTEKQAWLERSWKYAATLSPQHNSLKAHVLYHLLENHLQRDSYPKELFTSYIQLARPLIVSSKPSPTARSADLSKNYFKTTTLPAVKDDQALIRNYLRHILGANPDTSSFRQYFNAEYLTRIQAESQLLAGSDPSVWGKHLTPEDFRKLRDRTDVELASANAPQWTANDTVHLELDLKNTKILDVRVFKIDALTHLRRNDTPLSVDLKLNGLVPHHQQTLDFKNPPLVRHRHQLELPEIKGRGVWIVECISNGVSCRALVRKGSLHLVSRNIQEGQRVTLFDETNTPAHPATLWLKGKAYLTDKGGNITLPFASTARSARVILSAPQTNEGPENTASLATDVTIQRPTTDYQLKLNAGTDREQLLAGKTATLIIRPQLLNNQIATNFSELKKPTLHISAMLTGGITTELSDVTPDLSDLLDSKIITQSITVPEDTRRINIAFSGEIRHPGKEKPVNLSAKVSLKINEINDTTIIAQPLLSQTTTGWQIELLGRNGEAMAHRALKCRFYRIGFDNEIKQTLRTNSDGIIQLGKLIGIKRIRIDSTTFSTSFSAWLHESSFQIPENIHTLMGEIIRIGYPVKNTGHQPLATAKLIRDNGDPQSPVASMTNHLSFTNDELVIKDLPAGYYSLFLYPSAKKTTTIQVIEGAKHGPWLRDVAQTTEHNNPTPLHISVEKNKGKQLTTTIVGANKNTRVIAIGTRYYHAEETFNLLSRGTDLQPARWGHAYLGNETLNGRTLSDEYRYILERRQAKHYAGNMLTRPGLLLYPVTERESDALLTDTNKGMHGIPQAMKSRSSRSGGGAFGSPMMSDHLTASFDFLANQSLIQTDLKPASDGTLTLDLSDFPQCQSITLIAYDDQQTASQLIPLTAKKRITHERRLDRNLDPGKHYTATRATAILLMGASAEIKNVLDADWKAYTSLSHVYDYFYSQNQSEELLEFLQIMRWPELDKKQRAASGQLLASHEFRLFAYFKDRKWFDANIKPVLENKRHCTFIDQFLLGNDLTPYLSPWRYNKLNAAEKALLARAIPDQRKVIIQDLENSYALIKPNPEEETTLFASALKQNSLALRDRLGIAKSELASLENADRSVEGQLYIQNQLAQTIIPMVDFDHTTLQEAIDFLRLRMRELDPDNTINFIIRQPAGSDKESDIAQLQIKEFKLRDVPLKDLIQYICDATRIRYRNRRNAIEFLPLTSMEVNDIATRTFRVPPDFISKLSSPGDDEDGDPFGGGGSGASIKARSSVKGLLKANGISFPDNSNVVYIAETGTLIVHNTEANLDIIEQITSSIGRTSPDPYAGRAPMVNDSASLEDAFDSGDLLPSKSNLDKAAPAPAPILSEPDDLLTHIWSESNYYRHPNLGKGPVIKPNRFWIEFAACTAGTPFLSARFTECTDSPAAMLLALAVLDLPFKGEKPDAEITRLALKVEAKSPMLLFYRDTRETDRVADASPILVRRNFFRIGDRTRRDDQGRIVENAITGDFLTGVPYVTSFTITNPTGTPRELQVLTQIPRGAIPLSGQPTTQARDIKLKAHATQQIEYNFYFPSAGSYPHYPDHVLENGVVQAFAKSDNHDNRPNKINVLARAEKRDTRSWLAVARDGTDADILTRLQSANLHRTPLAPILWRLDNKAFYQKVVSLLRSRLHYAPKVFAYGFQHGDQQAVTTYLENNKIINQLGDHLDSPLLSLDSRERGHWEHLEFAPLVNPRQHLFQGKHTISNEQAHRQYMSVLGALSWKSTPSQDDLLTLTYHLFLQDRIDEALQQFTKINRNQIPTKMQYDYLHCYALFYQEKPDQASTIATQWLHTPSPRWRQRFEQVSQQAAEVAHHKQSTPKTQTQTQKNNPSSHAPRNLDLIPAKGGLTINYSSIAQVTLRLYSIDLEVLFSENPFINQQGGPQPSIQANKTMVVGLPKGKHQHSIQLPDELRFGNVLAMIEGDGFRRVLALDSTAHQVNRDPVKKTISITRSTDGTPIPRCYVKIYIEATDGKTIFFKDGYTDLRGLFPYESHTGIAPHRIKRFAIFTSHPKLGSKVTTYP